VGVTLVRPDPFSLSYPIAVWYRVPAFGPSNMYLTLAVDIAPAPGICTYMGVIWLRHSTVEHYFSSYVPRPPLNGSGLLGWMDIFSFTSISMVSFRCVICDGFFWLLGFKLCVPNALES
jgi:hypothetical protein